MALAGRFTLAPVGTAPKNLTTGQYLESKDTGKEAYSSGSSNATRTFYCLWNDRAAFVDYLLGFSVLTYTGVFWRISRELPDAHPELQNLWASEASVEGVGVPGQNATGAATFTLAKVSVPYKPVDYAILTDAQSGGNELTRFVTRKYQFAADYLTLQGTMQYVTRTTGQGKNLSVQPTKLTGTATKILTWHDVPAKPNDPFTPPNINTIQSVLGCVNSVQFDGHAEGTVLCAGVTVNMTMPKLSAAGFYWEIEYTFLIRDNGYSATFLTEIGHQFRYDTQFGRWDLITADGTSGGNKLYQTADLNRLFIITT